MLIAPPSLLQDFIADCASRCAAGDDLPADILHGQGYHTRVPNGARVRRTRDAMDYALALLAAGDADSVARAHRVIPRVLALQDREPCNRTFGLWPWFFEEPLAAMNPPDWNWADFIGVRLAHALGAFARHLPADLRDAMSGALGRAAFSIFRRNMGPDYTNISVKGGVVCVMAGELLGDSLLLAYGRERLARFLDHTRRNGGFTEYNSPPYGALVVLEVERGLLVVKDPEARAGLAAIHEQCWLGMAGSLHLPSGQLCGPHARAYDEALSATQARLLGEELGLDLFAPVGLPEPHEQGRDIINLLLIPRRPCPEPVRRRVLEAPARRFLRQDYVRSADPEVRRQGSLWFDGDLCLGSVNVENLWQQRRPLLAYWKVHDTVAVLRVRLTHGGLDFASGVLRCAQEGPAVLACCSLATNKADSHDHMDMPADGVFRFADLALSIELAAPDARVRALADGAHELRAGDHAAIIRPIHAEFDRHPVAWKSDALPADGKARVRAVVNGGAPVALEPAKMRRVSIAFHLCVGVATDGPASPPRVTRRLDDDAITLSADNRHGPLSLTCPRHPVPLR